MINLRYKFNKLRDNYFYGKFNDSLLKGKVFTPIFVAWDCSRKCNLNCVHCGAVKEKYKKELTTEQIKKLVDELGKIGTRFFGATGGEPLMRSDMIEVLEYAGKKGIRTGFATNGYFINEDIARRIKNAGIASIQISLDGSKETHNKIRRNNLSFQNAVRAIELLHKNKVEKVSVATTITPMNFGELEEIKNILLNLGVRYWRIGVIMPIGRANENNLMLKPGQLKELFKFVSSNKRKMNIWIGENLPFLADYEEKIRNAPYTCPVGFTACCIGVNGNVRGCPEMPDTKKFIEGNILKKPFSEIWKRGFTRYRNREILKSDRRCASCKSRYNCYGGCWVMREGGTHCIYDLISENILL